MVARLFQRTTVEPTRAPHRSPGRRTKALSWVLGFSTLCATAALAAPPDLKPAKNYGFGVASESPAATRDASRVLNSGGSAIDGAIVAALVAGVTSPTSSGIGGGGFALVFDKETGKSFVLDFRETAPAAAEREPFEHRPLDREKVGHLVGTPGEVRGLWDLHQAGGRHSWKSLVERAVQRAETGYFVNRHLAAMLGYAQEKLSGLSGFGPLFYPGGKPAVVGQRLTRPELAQTLRQIANEGPRAFYEGPVAEDIVATARAHGGKLALEDLARYQTVRREPLRVTYDEYEVLTMPPPSAGGLMMVQTLKMFPAEYLRHLGHGSGAYRHVLAEALRGAVADRMRYLGDPDHQKVDMSQLLDDERLEARREKIVLDRTHSLPRFGLEEKGTHALVTSDRQGNVVSLTTTINHLFGAKLYAERSGVVLNNELDDFTAREDVEAFSMKETPNRLRPHARPVSSMTPTIVLGEGEAVLALGGSGGTAIATNATQTLLSRLVFGHTAKQSVSADRIYIPTNGPHVLVEKGSPQASFDDLTWRGEVVDEMPFAGTAIQMLTFENGRVGGAADPRKHGSASVGR